MSSVPTATRHLQAGVGPRFARLVSQRARRQHVSLFSHVFKKVLLNFSVCFFFVFLENNFARRKLFRRGAEISAVGKAKHDQPALSSVPRLTPLPFNAFFPPSVCTLPTPGLSWVPLPSAFGVILV